MMFWDSEVAKRLLAQGALRPLDVQFARFIGKQAVLEPSVQLCDSSVYLQ